MWKSPVRQCLSKIPYIIFAHLSFDEKMGKNGVKIMRLNMVVTCRQHDTAEFYCSHVYVV
jgi:hypothetical protein